jgi:hypothetical protein
MILLDNQVQANAAARKAETTSEETEPVATPAPVKKKVLPKKEVEPVEEDVMPDDIPF